MNDDELNEAIYDFLNDGLRENQKHSNLDHLKNLLEDHQLTQKNVVWLVDLVQLSVEDRISWRIGPHCEQIRKAIARKEIFAVGPQQVILGELLDESGKPIAEVKEIIHLLKLGNLETLIWFTSPQPFLDWAAPAEMLVTYPGGLLKKLRKHQASL